MSEEFSTAVERVMRIAEEFRGAINNETGIMITGENFYKRYKYFQVQKPTRQAYKEVAGKIFEMTEKEILDSLWEYAFNAKKNIQPKKILTLKQKEIMQGIANGKLYKELGNQQTVKNDVNSLRVKFNCKTTEQLIKFLRDRNEIE